ncbi:MAG: formimidoylglutamate deiminase [Deltaproteobacteria bacterium]|nr:formimidoylglutamate deiminase [Deltaproteobacteria bacterium]
MHLICEHLHQPGGWLTPGILDVDEAGIIRSVAAGSREDLASMRGKQHDPRHQNIDGFVIPGLPNVHSHAFQRAMAGHAESAPAPANSSANANLSANAISNATHDFWSWRSQMYRVANAIDPDTIEAIAAQLYVEMLEAGMTSVGEFHYLHHAPDGRPYARASELSLRIVRASRRAGIALTHLPVLYTRGGFDRPAETAQRRFIHRAFDAFIDLVAELQKEITRKELIGDRPEEAALTRLGVAAHSLRAVPPDLLLALAQFASETRTRAASPGSSLPIHIHVAEQTTEVDECVQRLGARPVEWLLANADVSPAWCLVHATHMTPREREEVAARGAVVGLCPTTEANLGDGFFEAEDFIAHEGRFGIGSDSHVSVSGTEELRWLEYGERLRQRRRNILTPAQTLYERAVSGGAQALGQPVGALTPGARADLVALDAHHPALAGHTPATVFDAFLFGRGDGAIRDVMVGGRWCVRDGRHLEREAIRQDFRRALSALKASWSA